MKRLTLSIIIALIALTGFAQKTKVNWYSFEKAVELNKQEPKKILVDVYTDWCGWCKKMKKNTFNHPEIANYINKNFYAVRFDAESDKKVSFNGRTFIKKGDSRKRPHQLAIALLQGKMSYPSVAYLDENNNLITTVPGYQEPKDIEPILKFFVEDAYKRKSFQEFKKNYNSFLD